MPIRFPCTACGQLLGIATRKVGTEINCPTCGLAVIVPSEEQAKQLRQQMRSAKQGFSTPDTPPEIAIPRESHEAFDGGLENFLTQLEPAAVSSKPAAHVPGSTTLKSPAPPPARPTTSSKPAVVGKSSNGTYAAPPIKPSSAAVPPKAKPATQPAPEIPLALGIDDDEVSVLSAADLLEVADEPVSTPQATRAKVSPPVAKSPTLMSASKPVAPVNAPLAKQSASPKPPAAIPPPAFAAVSVVTPEPAPLLEDASPREIDHGFDFSASAVPAALNKKQPTTTKPAPVPAATAIPAPPYENAVWISRRAIYTHVAVLVLVSFVTFLIGWISGGSGARLPVGNNAGPVRFEAQIQYVAANGKTLPDEGAVILLWPKQAKPLERLSSKRLSPSEPSPPSDLPALKALEALRGAYARTNAQGEVRDMLLAEPGDYYVLVISRNLARPANEPINEKAIPILGDLFGGEALTLLGTRQFTLKSYLIAETRLLTHTFGAPAEK